MKQNSAFRIVPLVIIFIHESLQNCQLNNQKNVYFQSIGANSLSSAMECQNLEEVIAENRQFYKEREVIYYRYDNDMIIPAQVYIYEISILSSPANITSFPPKMKHILILRIEHTNLEVIHEAAMSIFLNLQELHLRGNSIQKIERNFLLHLQYLEKLDLSFNKIDTVGQDCFNNNLRLTTLLLNNNKISVVEKQFLANLTRLEIVDLSNNLIRFVDKEAFEYNKNLTKLLLNSNNIKIFSNPLFNSLQHLHHLDISDNPVETVDELVLKNLESLKSFNASGIGLTKGNLRMLKHNKNIEELSVSNNNLTEVSEVMFSYLTKLKTLDLSNNFIYLLEESSFYDMYDLRSIRINNNQLTTIPNKLFSYQKMLTHLDISNNPIEEACVLCLHNLLELTEVYLNDIGLNDTDLIGNLNRNVSFSIISVNNNYLTRVVPEMFSHLSNLTFLDVSSNSIEYMDMNAFSGLSNLRYLKIQNNVIDSLPSTLFKDTNALEYLDLSNNKLTNLPIGLFENLKNLLFLNLSCNQLDSFDRQNLYPLKNLKDLFIHNNKLSKIEGANYLLNLQTVSLRNNQWLCDNLFTFFETKENVTVVGTDLAYANLSLPHHIRHISCDSTQPLSSHSPFGARGSNNSHKFTKDDKKEQNSFLIDIDNNLRNILNKVKNLENTTRLVDYNAKLQVMNNTKKDTETKNFQKHDSESLSNIYTNLENLLQELEETKKFYATSNNILSSENNSAEDKDFLNQYRNDNFKSPMNSVEEKSYTLDYINLFISICIFVALACIIYILVRKKEERNQNGTDLLLESKM